MIIDSHTHMGNAAGFNLEESILQAIKKYAIDFAIVSNLEGIEIDPYSGEKENRFSQIEINSKTLKFVKKYPDFFKALFWIKANTEKFSREIENFILRNRVFFAGFKVHPFHSELELIDKKYLPYLEFAERHNMPVAVHTANDEYSKPFFVYDTAQKFSGINFIMVHMGLHTDNTEAINLIKALPNLYGDTTWVPIESILLAVKECGSEKILFGSDSPIDGIDTYSAYTYLIIELKKILPGKDIDNIFVNNAIKLFSLK